MFEQLKDWISTSQLVPQSWIEKHNHWNGARSFYIAFGSIPNFIADKTIEIRHPLPDSPLQITSPRTAARFWLLSCIPTDDSNIYLKHLEQLFISATTQELTDLYQFIQVAPLQTKLLTQAKEGVRSNILTVVSAVAHHNDFPKRYFEIDTWNQMILKLMFMDLPLFTVVGLDERRNDSLSSMLYGYAQERWIAKRMVPDELWRCVNRKDISNEHISLVEKYSTNGENVLMALQKNKMDSNDWDEIGKMYHQA